MVVWAPLVEGVGDRQYQHWGELDEGDFGGIAQVAWCVHMAQICRFRMTGRNRGWLY